MTVGAAQVTELHSATNPTCCSATAALSGLWWGWWRCSPQMPNVRGPRFAADENRYYASFSDYEPSVAAARYFFCLALLELRNPVRPALKVMLLATARCDECSL